jgi:hypothetical protein
MVCAQFHLAYSMHERIALIKRNPADVISFLISVDVCVCVLIIQRDDSLTLFVAASLAA